MRNKRFESWFAAQCYLELDRVIQMWDGRTYTDYSYHVELAWAALGFEVTT